MRAVWYHNRKPYRSRPTDFWDVFVLVGWGEAEAHFRAHKKTIRRWMDEVGYDELRAARAAHVDAERKRRRLASKQAAHTMDRHSRPAPYRDVRRQIERC